MHWKGKLATHPESMEELKVQVEEVTSSAQTLAEMAQALQQVVAQF